MRRRRRPKELVEDEWLLRRRNAWPAISDADLEPTFVLLEANLDRALIRGVLGGVLEEIPQRPAERLASAAMCGRLAAPNSDTGCAPADGWCLNSSTTMAMRRAGSTGARW
jgi:hypothetical protein